MRTVLGIDLASSKWSSVGTASIEFDDETRKFTRVVPGAIRWPATPRKPTPESLADAIDAFARRERVCAVALDGPQGWRDPATPEGTLGVGRRCEYACRTQGKTGAHPRTYPGPQRGWIEFCIDTFARLLTRPDVALSEPGIRDAVAGGYLVLECFPTSAWRSSGLVPLPGKSKKPDLEPYRHSLTAAFGLPSFSVVSHDDLQAVVAALTAAAAAGGPASPLPKGTPASLIAHPDGRPRRVEGYIWDVEPRPG